MIEIAGVKAVKHDTFVVDDTTGTLDHDDETGVNDVVDEFMENK